MVSVYVKAVPKTVGTISTGTQFPKIIFAPDGNLVAVDAAEETAAISGLDNAVVVWEPEETLAIELGSDFDTCVFTPRSSGSIVVKKKIPAPVLDPAATVTNNNPVLSWTNSYKVKTKIYRTSTYTTGNPTTDFTLIAQVDGVEVSGGVNGYTDSSITLGDDTQSVSYFVMNPNGTSATVEFTGPVV